MPGRNPIAAVGSVRNFMNIVKEVNFDEIRDRAEQAPRLLVIARTEANAQAASDMLLGAGMGAYVDFRHGEAVSQVETGRYDVVIVSDPDQTGLAFDVRKGVVPSSTGASTRAAISNLYEFEGHDLEMVEKFRSHIVMTNPDLAPALGRWFEPFRAPAVHAIIDETAKANAKFAFVSNVPSIIPIFGSLISAGADLIVLTKNQVMMAYKLAAANGRDLSDQTGILRELAPVVGAGFIWRTVAREATSFLPLLAGTIPKVGIAFAGTYTVGLAADYYYRFGQKPTREQMQMFSRQAVKLMASIPLPGRKASDQAEEAIEAELRQSVDEAGKPPAA